MWVAKISTDNVVNGREWNYKTPSEFYSFHGRRVVYKLCRVVNDWRWRWSPPWQLKFKPFAYGRWWPRQWPPQQNKWERERNSAYRQEWVQDGVIFPFFSFPACSGGQLVRLKIFKPCRMRSRWQKNGRKPLEMNCLFTNLALDKRTVKLFFFSFGKSKKKGDVVENTETLHTRRDTHSIQFQFLSQHNGESKNTTIQQLSFSLDNVERESWWRWQNFRSGDDFNSCNRKKLKKKIK